MAQEALFAVKDPDAVLDYQLSWGAEWLPTGDTISASSWTADSGITIDSSSNTTTATTVWLSGGTVGVSYRVTNHVTTAQGREDDRTIVVKVRER